MILAKKPNVTAMEFLEQAKKYPDDLLFTEDREQEKRSQDNSDDDPSITIPKPKRRFSKRVAIESGETGLTPVHHFMAK